MDLAYGHIIYIPSVRPHILVQIGQLMFGPMALFMFTMPDIAGGQQWRKRGAGRDKLRESPKARVCLYNEMQLLTDEYNFLVATFQGTYHGVLVSCVTLCVYIFVRTEGMMAALAAYMGLWGILGYLELMNNYAEIPRGSKIFLESLQVSRSDHGSGNWARTRRETSDANVAILSRQLVAIPEISFGGCFYL